MPSSTPTYTAATGTARTVAGTTTSALLPSTGDATSLAGVAGMAACGLGLANASRARRRQR